MKSRLIIWLAAVALLVLVIVQSIFIRETYTTKKRLIDSRYGALVREGLMRFNSEVYQLGLDSVLYLLDQMAVEFLFSDPDTLQPACWTAFSEVLEGYGEPEQYLREFVRMRGEAPDFTYHMKIKELYLLDVDVELQIHPGPGLPPETPKDAIMAGSYTHSRNFFRTTYEVYISLTDLTALVLKEMWFILALSLATLLLVFWVFLLTLRNMLREKRLSEMKTDFINNMTHELKTPLSTIAVASSSLGLPEVTGQGQKVEELSHLIRRQNRHLSELIDRILDINIWERDQVKVKKQPVQVESWLRELAAAFTLDQGREVTLEVRTDLLQGTVMLDEVHLSTAVNNLLSNAVKYGNAPCKIDLSVTGDKQNLILTVADNGPGIGKDEQKHIFEKFFRGAESGKRVIRGLGLGLYYVKMITEAHGGSVRVRSAPGKGTTFTLEIPVNDGDTAG